MSSIVLFAILRFATESIDIDEAVQSDPPKAPKTRIESDDLLTLDDDPNVNLSELLGASELLRKPIARFNALPRAQKLEQLLAGTFRYGPYAMFALLPAFAGRLKVLYVGRSRRYPARRRLYGEHLVFAAHNHAFLFVVGSLMGVVPRGFASGLLALWAIVYLVWSTRAVYGGRWLGIATRAMVLVVAYSVLFAFVTIGLVLAAILLR